MTKLKVVLVRPNYHTHLITPPLGLGYLASYLKERGYSPKIIDGLNLGYSTKEIVDSCLGADLVGINCLSAYFPEVIGLSHALKQKGLTVVIGGAHASVLPELTLRETHADYLIAGEGEMSLWELIESLEKNKPAENIPGVMTKSAGSFVKRTASGDLDILPYPDWEQIDPRAYKKAPHGGLVKSFPLA